MFPLKNHGNKVAEFTWKAKLKRRYAESDMDKFSLRVALVR